MPVVDDPDTGGFFAAVANGELALRVCQNCGAHLHLPKSYCHRCGSWTTGWRAVRPTGTVHTYTVVEHQVHPAFPVPYTLVLVALDDVPEARLVGHLPGRHDLVIGEPMEAELGHGTPLPSWRPAGGGSQESAS